MKGLLPLLHLVRCAHAIYGFPGRCTTPSLNICLFQGSILSFLFLIPEYELSLHSREVYKRYFLPWLYLD